MPPALLEVNDPSVHITVKPQSSTGVLIEFSGVLGHRDPGRLLMSVFDDVHRLMIDQRRLKAAVDFRDLRFMNSSCFKYFAKWIKLNNESPHPYAIHFILNKAFHWQEVSIHALRCFSVREITIEQVAGADK